MPLLKPINQAVTSALGILQAHHMLKTNGVETVVQFMTMALSLFPDKQTKVEFLKLLLDAQFDFSEPKKLAESLYVGDIMVLGQAGKLDDSGAPPEMSKDYFPFADEVWLHLTSVGFDFELHQKFIAESRERLQNLLEQIEKDQ